MLPRHVDNVRKQCQDVGQAVRTSQSVWRDDVRFYLHVLVPAVRNQTVNFELLKRQ